MRKKIGKRIGPVPIALVAVFALAAVISAGLLFAPNKAEAAVGVLPSERELEGSKCIAVVATGNVTGETVQDNANDTVVDGGCSTTGDSVDVLFQNHGTSPSRWVVYATGGDDFNIQASNGQDPVTNHGKKGLGEHRLPISAGAFGDPGEKMVTVTRSMSRNGEVYLFAYAETEDGIPLDPDADPPVSELPDLPSGGIAVKVVFLGDPVETFTHTFTAADFNDDNDMEDKGEAEATKTLKRSAVIVSTAATAPTEIIDKVFENSTSDERAEQTGIVENVHDGDVDRTGVTVIAEFNDARGRRVPGTIVVTIGTPSAGAEDVRFDGGGMSRTEYKSSFATFEVTNLPKGNDVESFKIPVTATLTSETGTLEVKTNIVRQGAAAMVEATAYVCEEDESEFTTADHDDASDTENTTEVGPADICNTEIAALTTSRASDDPDEVVALGPESAFFISAKAADASGNNVEKGKMLSWMLTSGADNLSDAKKAIAGNADKGSTDTPIMIGGGSDAVAGTYSITVESGDEQASTMVSVTVSDKASMIDVTCDPEMIPTNTGLTDCTVTVTDADGNIPSNLKKDEDGDVTNTVRVAVRSSEVTLIGPDDSNNVVLDNEGMAEFTILLREDAPEGSRITVNVSSAIGSASLQASTVVVYGDAPSEPGMPMNVMAMATSHDMITVSWDAVMDATSYMVERGYMDADNMMMWMTIAEMTMDMMYMDSGLMAETTYYYRVTAMNAVGSGEATDGMAMAMTMMMPPMELGAPSITSVMSDADGMATVMLMPGDNATKHWAWAAPTDGSEGMWHGDSAFAGDATMVTFSGLTSGMNYWFIAIAGRGTGTDSEWSAWSGWTAEKPIQ